MEIKITDQYLTGNSNEGFKNSKFLELLETAYRKCAMDLFPDADITVKIDVQNASGVSRHVECFSDDYELDLTELQNDLENVASDLGAKALEDEDFYE